MNEIFRNYSPYNPTYKQLSPVQSYIETRFLNLVFVSSQGYTTSAHYSFNLATDLQKIICQVPLMIYYSHTLVIFQQFGDIKMNNIYNRLICTARFTRILSLGLKFMCSSVNLCRFLNQIASRFITRSIHKLI